MQGNGLRSMSPMLTFMISCYRCIRWSKHDLILCFKIMCRVAGASYLRGEPSPGCDVKLSSSVNKPAALIKS